MTNWQRIQELLLENSEPIVRSLIAETNNNGDTIAAIGFAFEFGRGQLCFEMCANTARHAQQSVADFRAQYPELSTDLVRWNSGDYDFPGGVQNVCDDWSKALWHELSQLDVLATDGEQSRAVHESVAEICCAVLVELAKRGVFNDWSAIDFNVAALLDDVQVVKQRNERIKNLLRAAC